jgi:ComF family protein
MKKVLELSGDFISLFYPQVCLHCGNSLYKDEELICTFCRYKLPKTNYHLLKNNPVSKVFWGRATIESAAAFLFFTKGGMVQDLLHQLKYKGKKELGVLLGKLFAYELKKSILFDGIQTIIPVPLHPRKQGLRGFNQSEQISLGISQVLKLEMDTKSLIRKRFTSSQTRKNRYDRWLNVGDMFEVTNKEKLHEKHILLVDDVITTGATLEGCAQALSSIPGIKISIACLAMASV